MKHLICGIIILACMSGCFSNTYGNTRIGPDRYAIKSVGPDYGPENYTELLKQSYEVCTHAGFNDYRILNQAYEPRHIIIYVQCQDTQLKAVKADEKESQLITDLRELYNSTKKKLAK